MDDPVRARRRVRDAGLAMVNRWTRRAVAAGVVLCGVLGVGLAHLLPGQASAARHATPSPAESVPRGQGDPTTRSEPPAVTGRRHTLTPPDTVPRPSRGDPHVTSGGS